MEEAMHSGGRGRDNMGNLHNFYPIAQFRCKAKTALENKGYLKKKKKTPKFMDHFFEHI